MTDTHSPEPSVPAEQPKTLRRGLQDRRQAALDELHLDRRVPRMDPPVFVRFRPLTGPELEKAQKAIEKGKSDDRSVVANANALASACIGIYEVVDGEKTSAELIPESPEWSEARFDDKLGRALGHESMIRASDVVRALYLTDGDIMSEAGELVEWSGFVKQEQDDDFSGN